MPRPEAFSRRQMLFLIGAGAISISSQSMAQEIDQFYPLTDDDGHPVSNLRVPSELDPLSLPGIILAGSAAPDVILCEFFDYNCPFCRKASPEIDAFVQHEAGFRLALINNPILSPESVEAARVQQSVLRAYGPLRAYAFHTRLLAIRGVANRVSALGIAADLQVDTRPIIEGAADSHVLTVVDRQAKLAADLSLTATPSFVLDETGILGWPGSTTLRSMISASRRCGRPYCANGSSTGGIPGGKE